MKIVLALLSCLVLLAVELYFLLITANLFVAIAGLAAVLSLGVLAGR